MWGITMKRVYDYLLHIYFTFRTWWPFWFYVLNYKNRKLLKNNPPLLNKVQKKILAELKKEGIATSSLEELFPGKNLLSLLQGYAESTSTETSVNKRKPYLNEHWGVMPELTLDNPFVTFSLSQEVLGVASSYLEMFVKFKTFNLNRISAVPKESEEVYSQKWHRDPQEKRICKVFVYLTDVEKENGPFIYIPESSYGKKWGHLFPQYTPLGSYPKKEILERKIPPEYWRIMTAKAGTVIFCDTTGLHKGGFVQKDSRLMFTAVYAAPTFKEASQYTLPQDFSKIKSGLSNQALFSVLP